MKLSPVQVSSYFMQKLESFRVFIELSERQWREESASYERSLNIDEDEALSWDRYGYRNDLAANITQEFPQYQRQSQLIMVISLFEDYLNQLCLSFKKANRSNVTLTDIRGSGIERAKTYLKKVVGIPFPSDDDSWTKMNDLGQAQPRKKADTSSLCGWGTRNSLSPYTISAADNHSG